ncbi:MAG: penicillin-binding protein activator LpoB [Burkholderiaceae bacterium]|nr:penicillin-binding protein activator LpoB [Burkholderiaceae bacterium]
MYFPTNWASFFNRRRFMVTAVATTLTVLAGCAVTQRSAQPVRIAMTDKVALLPIVNHTDVPQAGLRAEAIAEATLRAKGLRQLVVYPPNLNPETLFEPGERKALAEAEKWARAQGMRYAVYGAVDEWRYKVGVDGEPAVGLVFQVKDLQSSEVVYSASGGKSGWSREALSAVAQKLSIELMSGIQVDAGRAVKP